MTAKRGDQSAQGWCRSSPDKNAVSPQCPPKEPVEDGDVDPDRVRFPIVGIGASAGGLEAFENLFKVMPSDCGMAFVLVAHLDPTHVSLLPELVQRHTTMPVRQVQDGDRVAPNSVYVIPPNHHLGILDGTLQLLDLPRPRGTNPPIDVFLRSLAQDQGSNAVCIILSGTGTDGTLGLKAIKGEGGMAMVQDEESARYGGMPRSAVATGLADYVLPPEEMPESLISYTSHTALTGGAVLPTGGKVPDALQKIFILLRAQSGHDFSLYKKNTICRRIERRMAVHQIEDISTYVRYLQESEREINILFKELLIGVTNFFRDPKAFEALKNKALVQLLEDRPTGAPLRVWVPGCSSGEEAYSVAILLHECMEEIGRSFTTQVFATDIDEDAVSVARAGLYPESIVGDIGSERLKRHFYLEEDGQYRVKKTIREMIVFAVQNIIKDPPFTKLDLISCRNLLIYLGSELQKKILPLFQYSLTPGGILFLGTSETIGQATDLFSTVDAKSKIFRRNPSAKTSDGVLDVPRVPVMTEKAPRVASAAGTGVAEISDLKLVEAILRSSGAPCSVVVDEAFDVVYIHGRTGRYLEPAQGRPSMNIISMARPGLKQELSTALRMASLNKTEVVRQGLRLEIDGAVAAVDLSVRPVTEYQSLPELLMIIIEEAPSEKGKTAGKTRRAPTAADSKTIEKLEQELRYTKESLQTTIEQLETANEELKSTNEELQSTNEELQSTNEELETSREELQSLNEEASTVNVELQSRVDELSNARDDMQNLLDSTNIATIFLDSQLCIRRFTPTATDIVPLAPGDVGRPLRDLSSSLIDVDLVAHAEGVLGDLRITRTKVTTTGDSSYLMRIRPYRTLANQIDGVVFTFEDLTELKRALRSSTTGNPRGRKSG